MRGQDCWALCRTQCRRRPQAVSPIVPFSPQCGSLKTWGHPGAYQNAVSGELLPRRFRPQLENETGCFARDSCGRETVAATEARLAGVHDVLHIDNSIVMR